MTLTKAKYFVFILSLLFFISCNDDDDSNVNDHRTENIKALGVSAGDLLSENTYTSLTVEIAYSKGFRPLQETLNAFRAFLEERLNKPNEIVFLENEINTPLEETQSIAEIKELEAEHREHYTTGNDIAVFIYFTHAISEEDTEATKTLGTAYYNTSLVVFEKTLRDLNASEGYDLFILEETTLQHEFCHLLGLVNLRNDDIHGNHVDKAHGNHCIVEDCLMYYASNISSFFSNKSSLSELDTLCIEDLQAKGGK